jgi:hypothetical protein
MNRVLKYRFGQRRIAETKLNQPEHLFVVSASFEERCLAVTSSLTESCKSENTLIIYNKEFLKRGNTEYNLKELQKKAKGFSNNIFTKATSIQDRQNIISAIHDVIEKNSIALDGKTITIDITTFPRHELLLMLRYIRMLNPRGKFRLLYTRPRKYGDWLSYGVKEVTAVPSYGGTQIPGRKKLLIILSGFEWERMFRLWEEHEPSKTILVIGDPPTNKHFLTINRVRANILKHRTNVQEDKASASDPFKFYKKIEQILMDHKKEYNIFVSPLNTKIQAVGLFLLAEKYTWFQITTAVPNDYNVENYSEGAEIIYEFFL